MNLATEYTEITAITMKSFRVFRVFRGYLRDIGLSKYHSSLTPINFSHPLGDQYQFAARMTGFDLLMRAGGLFEWQALTDFDGQFAGIS